MPVKKIQIVSLSKGILGEDFIAHELKIGIERLQAYGVEVCFSKHALKGMAFLEQNPQARAEDLLQAFADDSIDMILCAIGGDDTYRLLPYLFENDELAHVAKQKVFLGYSDTTVNHFMLHKLGLHSFYGQSFLSDVCELDKEMLPYSKFYFEELLHTGRITEVQASPLWYEERNDFSPQAVGTAMPSHTNHGFELLQGKPAFEGKILGGCIETMYDMFNNTRHTDSVALCNKYQLFPSLADWKGKILLLESAENKSSTEQYRKMLQALANFGIFDVVNGVLVGKPANNCYYEEYKDILPEVIANKKLPIVYNVNIGHANPRCILPLGVPAKVDVAKQKISFE
ncbi:MAG: LD-carboxypeptidase [Eubacteriales bacterium]|nr:LD-carboxypeptidase [Eubacteriales bacterium]